MKILRIAFCLACVWFASCREQVVNDIIGQWTLRNAELNLENLDTDRWQTYTYFNDTITINSLDIDGSNELIDSIHRDSTIWEIDDNSIRVNNKKNYELTRNYETVRVFPTANGSARVFFVDYIDEDCMILKGRETYESLGDTNYYYFSTLYFDRND